MIKKENIRSLLTKNNILFFLIFIVFLFLRFYQIETKSPFSWDQVDNAWAAKNIIVDHKFPLLGMVAKQNSDFYIGPLYYYLIFPFYWLLNLDPIVSGIFAGITSIFTFLTLIYITKKIFSTNLALIAAFFYAISYPLINFDRYQWPVNFIPSISLIIFYCLYKITAEKSEKHVILLSVAFGFSIHIHFTFVFYPLLFLLSLPFFPRTKQMIKYLFFSFFIFFAFLIPNIIAEISSKNVHTGNMFSYLNTYYHGFHLTRVIQLAKDAFIQFESILSLDSIKPLKYLLIPIFVFLLVKESFTRKNIILSFLIIIWFIVPWFVFSTYKGEISDYYFSINKLMVIMISSYLILKLFQIKNIILNTIIVIILISYSIFNLDKFFNTDMQGLDYHKKITMEKIKKGEKVEFQEGVPESFIYYFYTKNDKH